MSDKLDATISISADTSGVEAGIDKTKKSLKTLGGAAQQMAGQLDKSGKAAGAGFDVIGAGATRSAKEIERATRTSARELQRQIAELKAGGKATREYAEALASLRGADINALRPLLDQLDQARKKTDAATSSFSGFKAMAASAIAGLSVGAFVSEITAITKETAKAAAEIERFSTLSNTSAQEFQRLAAGANTVGISAEKMADIFKDVQDKVGDFVQTGGGGMADFFERVAPKVGVTAENFRKLSGKDALQLYVSSLEKANLAHSDMVFFMEAIASDSSLLLPLLKDQGQAWQELGDKAEAYGAVMDAGLLDSARRFKTETDNLTLANQGLKNELMSGLLPALTELTSSLSDQGVQAGMRQTITLLGEMASGVVALGTEFMLGMKHADGFWDALFKYGLSNPFKNPQEQLDALGSEIEKEKKRAQDYSLFWTEAQKRASAERIADMEQQAGYYQGLIRLERQYQTEARNRKLDQENAWWTKNYKSRAPAQESALSPAFTKPTAKKTSSLSAEESAYKSLSKSITELLTQQNLEIATGEKLTSAQKLRLKVEQEVAKSKQAGLLAQIDEIEAGEAWLKNQTDANKALADMQRAREQSLKSVQDSVRQLLEEAEAAAYAETHNISLAEAVERLALARAENAYQQAVERQEAPATLAALEAELQARKKIVELTAQKGVKEANKKAAEQAAKDWEKVSQTIGDTLADYIMGGGKNAAQYLKRLFATLVLQPVVNYGVNTAMGALGMGQAGTAAGSVLGGNNVGTTILNNAGAIGAGFQAMYGMSVGASSASLVAANAVGMVGGDALGALIAGNGAWAGVAVEAGATAGAAAGAAAAEGAAAGAAGAAQAGGFMSGVAAAAPWIAGALAIYSIAKSFDNSGTPHYGAGAIYQGGAVTGGADIYNLKTFGMGARGEWNANAQTSVSGIATALGASLDGFAKAFGKEAGYTVATAFADDSSSDGAWGSLRIKDALGNVLVDWERSRSSKWAPRIFADGEAGYQQYLAAVAVDVKQAFLAMDLPGWADEVLATAKDIDTLSAAIQQIGAIKTVFDGLGQSMAMFRDLSGAAQTKLLQVSGSVDTLASNAQSFYANYYSEQERLDATVASLTATFAKYGAALPATTEQYRALVEQQMAAGEAGAEFAAVLLGLNGIFKQVADAWKAELDSMEGSVGEFFDGLKSSISDLAADVAADRKGILRGTGVLTADQLRAAIAQTSVVAVSTSSIDAASRETATAASYADVRDAQLRTAQAAADARQQAIWDKLPAAPRTDRPGLTNDALWEEVITQQWNAHWARFGKGWNTRTTSDAERAANMDAMVSMYDQRMRERLQTQANAQAAADASGIADAQKAADEARLALQAAQQEEAQARVDYAAKINQFVADANGSITKLSELRGEVVSFYEAQAQAVQTMLQSAGNLRSVVDQLRLGQLDSAQTAAELSSRYAANYSMALATSGSTRAGYVDAMAGSLPALTDALKAQAVTGEDWRIQTAKLFAQATTAAGLLEGDAKASDYQEVALGLLDSIDGALSELGSAAQSAQDLIVSAIEQGSASNLVGLRAVIAALKGDPIPAFAAGGLHAGGLRIVGEHGPELEATGPARIWNASQTAAMLGGGSINMQRVERLLEQRNEEARAQASAIVRLQQDVNRLLMRWETQGMPEQREVSAT